jgi:eukaryotic-like serine/threonine-protein kinase
VDLGRFTEALTAFRRGHEIGTKRASGWTHPSAEWIRDCERLIQLEAELPAVLKGSVRPATAAEAIEFARLCRDYKQSHAAAARLFEAAFTARSEVAEDLRAGHRYRAACSAALAGRGQGQDAAELDESARAHWRNRARTWLRADLAAWAKHAEGNNPRVLADVQRALQSWRQEEQLAGIRDAAVITNLPAEEQSACKQLWTDVADLLRRTEVRK